MIVDTKFRILKINRSEIKIREGKLYYKQQAIDQAPWIDTVCSPLQSQPTRQSSLEPCNVIRIAARNCRSLLTMQNE